MTLPLYLAPLHRLSNWVFRHWVLGLGADFVFSELIMVDRWDDELSRGKLKCFPEDLPKTIFQIGANSVEEISFAVSELKKIHPSVVEVNLNVGCPQSSMLKRQVCGGLLLNEDLLFLLAEALVESSRSANILPSVKIRLGSSPEKIRIRDYLSLLRRAGVGKVYIHARPLRYNYSHPALWDVFGGLVEEFPDMDLVFNGDVDSFEAYSFLEKFSPAGVMVGRAALSNPLIFRLIKDGVPSSAGVLGVFNPELKDPGLLRDSSGFVSMSETKKVLVEEFVSFAREEGLREEILSSHIAYLNKGVSKK